MTRAALWALLWGDSGSFHEVHIGTATCWIPCPQRRAFVRLLNQPDVRVSFVPRIDRDVYALAPAHVLWCRTERPACAALLGRLPVAPSLVIREGRSSRRTALWALSRPVSGDWVTRGNERLSHACQGRRGAADVAELFPSPFSGNAWVEYESDSYATAREIVGRLRDAPDANAWRAAA